MPDGKNPWQDVFTLKNIECCAKGMQLAESFLAACGQSLEYLDKGQPETGKSAFLERWQALVTHRESCPNCQPVK